MNRPLPVRLVRAEPVPQGPVAAPDAPELEVITEEPRRRRWSVTLIGWLTAVTVVVALFGMAAFHALIVQGQGSLDTVTRELEEARAETERLRLEVAELEAPERIVAEAERRLGMVAPSEVVYLAPSRQAGPSAAAGPGATTPGLGGEVGGGTEAQ